VPASRVRRSMFVSAIAGKLASGPDHCDIT
jgi:hypothetical protein